MKDSYNVSTVQTLHQAFMATVSEQDEEENDDMTQDIIRIS